MTERERLAEMISEYILIRARNPNDERPFCEGLADFLLTRGVIVPPCKVGDTVWCVLEDKRAEGGWFIGEEHVTDVGARGIWLSAFDPPKDDHGNFIPWVQVGVDTFTTREEAEAALAERRKASVE